MIRRIKQSIFTGSHICNMPHVILPVGSPLYIIAGNSVSSIHINILLWPPYLIYIEVEGIPSD